MSTVVKTMKVAILSAAVAKLGTVVDETIADVARQNVNKKGTMKCQRN